MSLWSLLTSSGSSNAGTTGHTFGAKAKADPNTVTVSRTGGLFSFKNPETAKAQAEAADTKPWWR